MKAIRTSLLIIAAIYGIATTAYTLFTAFDTTDVSIIEMVRTAYWFIIIPVPLCILLLLVYKRWRLALLYVPTATMIILTAIPSWLPKVTAADERTNEISVLTFNILSPYDGADRIADIIRAADADIVALQELGTDMAIRLTNKLADVYAYNALHAEEGQWNYYRGVGVFSKYPITENAHWRYDEFYIERPEGRLLLTHGHMRVLIDVEGTDIVVYNTHPWAPFERHEDGIAFLPQTDIAHSTALERITDMAIAETAAVIVVGDLNMSDQFEEYKRLNSHFTDSYRVGGLGLGFTYPACGLGLLPPLIRLDYVFHSEHFRTIEAEVIDGCRPSDHNPVMAKLSF